VTWHTQVSRQDGPAGAADSGRRARL